MPQVLLDDILKDVGVGSLLDENPTFTIEADAAVAHNIGLVRGVFFLLRYNKEYNHRNWKLMWQLLEESL